MSNFLNEPTEVRRIIDQLRRNPISQDEYPNLRYNLDGTYDNNVVSEIDRIIEAGKFNPRGAIPFTTRSGNINGRSNFTLANLSNYTFNWSNSLQHVVRSIRSIRFDQFFDFDYATMIDANFSNTTIHNIAFQYVDLNYGNFDDSEIYSVIFNGSNLAGTSFINHNYYSTTKCHNIAFFESNLTNAEFKNADLRDSSFDFSILYRTNFTNANIENVDFTNVERFSEVNFLNVRFNEWTIIPLIALEEAINISPELRQHIENQARQLAIPEARPPEGIAFEVHNMFDKINIDGYNEIINKALTRTPKLRFIKEVVLSE